MTTDDYVTLTVKALMPTRAGTSVFLHDGKKTILFFVDPMVGMAMSALIHGNTMPRPSTYELIEEICVGEGMTLNYMMIESQQDEVLIASMRFTSGNELHDYKVLDVDCRPGDGICLALKLKAPIRMKKNLWRKMENVTKLLKNLEKDAPENYGPDIF